jgi:hypothetical protein
MGRIVCPKRVGVLSARDRTRPALFCRSSCPWCDTMYFGMSVSDDYLAATVNTAAVAKHHGVKALVNVSQMTVAQMSITETTPSPQHKCNGSPSRR